MSLEELSEMARDLADALRQGTAAPCSGNPACLQIESERPPGRLEKRQGWTRRPLWAYDPANLCLACAARWHAELAAQSLESLHGLRARGPVAVAA